MEDYLLYMKTLRSQMNDVEDQAAKISVEEQMQITTIQTLQKDLDLAHSDIKQVKEETDQMVKAEGQICAQILEKQRKIAYMESDSSTLSQAKFVEKRIKDKTGEQIGETEGKCSIESYIISENVDHVKNLVTKLQSAKAKFDLVKQSVELVKCRISDFKPELWAMNVKTLEEEYQALLSDRAGETEYLHSLQQQFERLKDISHVVKCACGEEYSVEVDLLSIAKKRHAVNSA
ncbi:unnamed protein product [Camellia sinensis]